MTPCTCKNRCAWSDDVKPRIWTFSLSRGLMRDFGTIVRVLGCVMGDRGHDLPMCNTVAPQLVGHETRRFLSLPLQEFPKESPRRTPVPAGLDEEVDQVPVLVHGAPEILALTVDRDEDLVQKPRIAEATLSSLQPPGVVGAKLPAPLPNGSYDTMMPRSASRSSTSRKLRQYLCTTTRRG